MNNKPFRNLTHNQKDIKQFSANNKQINLNWKNVFLIVSVLVLVFVSLFITRSINKRTIAEYQTEIENNQNDLFANYQQILDSTDKSANELLLEGIKLLENNQLELSSLTLAKSASLDPNFRDAHTFSGYAYLKLAQNSTTNPDLKQSSLASAKNYLLTAESIDPLDSRTQQLLGTTYFELGDAQMAQLCYNKAKEFSSENID